MKDILIAVPYRNRAEHLTKFLENTPAYFNQQDLTYDIIICELDQVGDWNAGICVNSIVDFIKDKQYKWLYIHHVDIYPESGDWVFPEDKEYFYNIGDYGSCLLPLEAFLQVGGYSNSFWGWGGEDNDLYTKLQKIGFKNTDFDNRVAFFQGFQNHPRPFNGQNYANGIKNLYLLDEEEKNNISNFHEHGYTRDLEKIADNVYKHIVVPTKVSADKFINNKAILTYSKNLTSFDQVAAFVKSASMFSGYAYDIIVLITDSEPNEHYVEQVGAHGARAVVMSSKNDNIFIDRYMCFKEFLESHPQYEHVIHVDLMDSFFQANPFKYISTDKLTITSEDILIKDQYWNLMMMRGFYIPDIVEKIIDRDVLRGGIIGGPVNLFIELSNAIINEYNNMQPTTHGVDQAIIMKLLYHDNYLSDKIEIKTPSDNFGVNLHVHFYDMEHVKTNVIVESRCVKNNKNEKFAIVHQYNRANELYANVVNHFNQFFAPM